MYFFSLRFSVCWWVCRVDDDCLVNPHSGGTVIAFICPINAGAFHCVTGLATHGNVFCSSGSRPTFHLRAVNAWITRSFMNRLGWHENCHNVLLLVFSLFYFSFFFLFSFSLLFLLMLFFFPHRFHSLCLWSCRLHSSVWRCLPHECWAFWGKLSVPRRWWWLGMHKKWAKSVGCWN